jgi:hypothetical protein
MALAARLRESLANEKTYWKIKNNWLITENSSSGQLFLIYSINLEVPPKNIKLQQALLYVITMGQNVSECNKH